MEILIMILSSVAVPILFLLLTYWMDRHQPEPIVQLAKAILLGGTVALLALSFTAILNKSEWIYVGDTTTWSHFKQAFFGAALPEEMSKLIMLWILLKNNKYFDEFLDGIVYAVFIAMGFAAVENICYVLTNPAHWQAVIIGRSVLSVPAHFCYAAVMGVCYSFWRFHKLRYSLYAAIVIPILLHGTFDFCLNEITPNTNNAYIIAIIVAFVLLVVLMIGFTYWGITTSKETDDKIRSTIEKKLWKLSVARSYMFLSITLCCTLLLNGEPAKSSTSITYELSPELTEFRDGFCLKVRNAFKLYATDHDKQSLRHALEHSLGNLSMKSFKTNQEFAMVNHKIRFVNFSELIVANNKKSVDFSKHLKYNPEYINDFSGQLFEMPTSEVSAMYEIIHNINKWSTDGNATVVKLTQCKCKQDIVQPKSTITYNLQCYGPQELLLVSENGGNLKLSLEDLTHNTSYSAQSAEGASWVTWNMKINGQCRITVTNPTTQTLSFVIASTQKNNSDYE